MRRAYLVAAWALWGLLCLIVGAYLGRAQTAAVAQVHYYRPVEMTAANLLQCPVTARGLQEWRTACIWRERMAKTKPKGE